MVNTYASLDSLDPLAGLRSPHLRIPGGLSGPRRHVHAPRAGTVLQREPLLSHQGRVGVLRSGRLFVKRGHTVDSPCLVQSLPGGDCHVPEVAGRDVGAWTWGLESLYPVWPLVLRPECSSLNCVELRQSLVAFSCVTEGLVDSWAGHLVMSRWGKFHAAIFSPPCRLRIIVL